MYDMSKIDTDAHYFILMHPLEAVITPWGPLVYTSNNTREKWVECEIVKDTYTGYKMDLQSVEPGYGRERMYVEDFLSCLKQERIVKKEPGMYCTEETWLEPLTSTVNVRHTAYVLKKEMK